MERLAFHLVTQSLSQNLESWINEQSEVRLEETREPMKVSSVCLRFGKGTISKSFSAIVRVLVDSTVGDKPDSCLWYSSSWLCARCVVVDIGTRKSGPEKETTSAVSLVRC